MEKRVRVCVCVCVCAELHSMLAFTALIAFHIKRPSMYVIIWCG
jgi:hypothetical protein